jgi:hypothetical protein
MNASNRGNNKLCGKILRLSLCIVLRLVQLCVSSIGAFVSIHLEDQTKFIHV